MTESYHLSHETILVIGIGIGMILPTIVDKILSIYYKFSLKRKVKIDYDSSK